MSADGKCPCCGEALSKNPDPALYDWCGFCCAELQRLERLGRELRVMVLTCPDQVHARIREASITRRKIVLSCNHPPDAVFYVPCPKCGRSTDWSGG